MPTWCIGGAGSTDAPALPGSGQPPKGGRSGPPPSFPPCVASRRGTLAAPSSPSRAVRHAGPPPSRRRCASACVPRHTRDHKTSSSSRCAAGELCQMPPIAVHLEGSAGGRGNPGGGRILRSGCSKGRTCFIPTLIPYPKRFISDGFSDRVLAIDMCENPDPNTSVPAVATKIMASDATAKLFPLQPILFEAAAPDRVRHGSGSSPPEIIGRFLLRVDAFSISTLTPPSHSPQPPPPIFPRPKNP